MLKQKYFIIWSSILLMSFLLFNSCLFLIIYDIAKTERPHNWLKTETTLNYDLNMPHNKIKYANKITIIQDSVHSDEFYFRPEGIDSFFNEFFTINLRQGLNGIKMDYEYEDPYDFFDFGYLRVPDTPIKGDTIQMCFSRDSVTSTYIVTTIDTTIETSLGEFNCFCMDNSDLNLKEYWNEESGLILFEVFNIQHELQKSFIISDIELRENINE